MLAIERGLKGISPGQAGRRTTGRVRWLIVSIVAVIGLSVQLGFWCWATVVAVVVTPLHFVLRALA